MRLIDYHVHPGYSVDAADDSIEEFCQRGHELGLDEICFTPHFEFDPTRSHLDGFVRVKGRVVPMNGDWLEAYCYEVSEMKSRFIPLGLQIRLGIEIGYDLGLEDAIARIVNNYPFDFVLGSVHCVDHLALSSNQEYKVCFAGKTLRELACKYYHTVHEGVKSGLFDVLGHLDLYRRFGISYYGEAVSDIHQGLVEPVLELAAQKGIGLEINTSSVKQGLEEFYPSMDILKTAVQAGVSVFTTGSDAHCISELGRGIDEGTAILRELGVRPATFVNRRPKFLEKL